MVGGGLALADLSHFCLCTCTKSAALIMLFPVRALASVARSESGARKYALVPLSCAVLSGVVADSDCQPGW